MSSKISKQKFQNKNFNMTKNIIPKQIANSYPKKCPVCDKKCIAVFRTWKPTRRVSCTFLHFKGDKTCKKTFNY